MLKSTRKLLKNLSHEDVIALSGVRPKIFCLLFTEIVLLKNCTLRYILENRIAPTFTFRN